MGRPGQLCHRLRRARKERRKREKVQETILKGVIKVCEVISSKPSIESNLQWKV